MEFFVKLPTCIIKSGWSIENIEVSLEFRKNIVFLSLLLIFVLINSIDPGEMLYFSGVFTVC